MSADEIIKSVGEDATYCAHKCNNLFIIQLTDLKYMLVQRFLDLLIRKTLSVGRRPTKGITSVGEHATRQAYKWN